METITVTDGEWFAIITALRDTADLDRARAKVCFAESSRLNQAFISQADAKIALANKIEEA